MNKKELAAFAVTQCEKNGMFITVRPSLKFFSGGETDFIGCCPNGRFFAIAIAEPEEQISNERQTFIDNINAKTLSTGIVARTPKDIANLIAILLS